MLRRKPMRYRHIDIINELQVLEQAAEILKRKFDRGGAFSHPKKTKGYLAYKLSPHDREVFAVMLLDNQHQLIEFKPRSSVQLMPRVFIPEKLSKVC